VTAALEEESSLGIDAIQQIIPHRFPFLLVDRIIELVPGERAVGLKNVSANEYFFQGHFPGHPVMPGVLIVEAMAQTAAVMMLAGENESDSRRIPLFAGMEKVKFRRPVVPGDQLRLELTMLQQRAGTCRLAGRALVGEELAAQAQILAVIRKVDGGAAG
jgi:3-hydroxyacyl-[acyl-carrier-protein] dehydratase